MNICIESFVLNHPRRSGLMTYTEGLVNGLFKNDKVNHFDLAYYSLRRSPQDMPGPEGERFQKHVLRVADRDFWMRQQLIDAFLLPQFFKAHKIRVFHRPAGYTMPQASQIFKVLTIHDLRTLTIKDGFWAQNIGNYQKTVNSLDACVVVSECTKQDILRHFAIKEEKIKVIHLGADERFKPAEAKAQEAVKSKYDLHQPFLFSVGSVPRKNIDGIIRAFAASKAKTNFTLVLGSNMDTDKYRQRARQWGVEPQVKILSHLTDEDVVALFSCCHAFVFPSLYEGFGLPILEAMQCGAAVITSNGSSCPEVAGDAAVLVDPNNIQEISAAINEICQNNQLRQDLVQKGFGQAKRFSWDNFAQAMQKVYALA